MSTGGILPIESQRAQRGSIKRSLRKQLHYETHKLYFTRNPLRKYFPLPCLARKLSTLELQCNSLENARVHATSH